jgi:hypothetical protein
MVTLSGWVAIRGGLFRMFAPEAQQTGQNSVTYTALALLFVFGTFLTFKAYRREDEII